MEGDERNRAREREAVTGRRPLAEKSWADLRHRNNRSTARSTGQRPAPRLLEKRETWPVGAMVTGWLPPALKLLEKREGSPDRQPVRCRRNRKRGKSSQN